MAVLGQIREDAYQEDLGFSVGNLGKGGIGGPVRGPAAVDKKTQISISKRLQVCQCGCVCRYMYVFMCVCVHFIAPFFLCHATCPKESSDQFSSYDNFAMRILKSCTDNVIC